MNYSAKLWQASYSLSVVSESVGLLIQTALPEMLYIPSMNPKNVIVARVKKGERVANYANQNQPMQAEPIKKVNVQKGKKTGLIYKL